MDNTNVNLCFSFKKNKNLKAEPFKHKFCEKFIYRPLSYPMKKPIMNHYLYEPRYNEIVKMQEEKYNFSRELYNCTDLNRQEFSYI